MALQGITVLTLIGIVQIIVGQQALFGLRDNRNIGFPFGGGVFNRDPFINDQNDFWGNVQETTVYTCVGKNTNGDEMRVTFTDEEGGNRWNRWFEPQRVQMEARVTVSGRSQTRGRFQLIATEYGRVEDGCVGQALGDIVGSNMFMGRRRNSEIGILGRPFTLAPNQGHTATRFIQGFANAAALNGHGLALCASNYINAGTCNGIIPLCCKIGRDSRRATEMMRPQFGGNGSPNGFFAGQNGMLGGNVQGGMQGGIPGAPPAGIPNGVPGGLPGALPGSPGNGGLPGSTGTAGAGAPQFQALFGGA